MGMKIKDMAYMFWHDLGGRYWDDICIHMYTYLVEWCICKSIIGLSYGTSAHLRYLCLLMGDMMVILKYKNGMILGYIVIAFMA